MAKPHSTALDENSRHRSGLAWILVLFVAAAGLVGCGLGLAQGPAFSSDVDAEVAAGQASGFVLDPEGFEQLNSVQYAGIDIAIIEARLVPRNSSGRPIIVVELAVRNGRTQQLRLPDEMLTLVNDANERIEPIEVHRFEYTRFTDRLVIEPGGMEQAAVVFRLPPMTEPNLDEFTLTISESGRLPVEMPLDGELRTDTFPQDLAADDFGPIIVGDLTATVSSAVSDLDYAAYRALEGHHMVVVDIMVEAPTRARSALDVAAQRGYWALQTGDGSSSQEVEPARVEVLGTRAVGLNRSSDLRLVFEVEAGYGELDLVVGPDQNRTLLVDFIVPPFG